MIQTAGADGVSGGGGGGGWKRRRRRRRDLLLNDQIYGLEYD